MIALIIIILLTAILLSIYLWRRDILKKIGHSHQGRYVSLSDAKRAGLLINASDPGAYDCISIFKEKMELHNIDYIICCLDLRRKSARAEMLPESDKILMIHCKQLKWYGAPIPEITEAFAENALDILIDFTLHRRHYPLEYLFRHTRSTLRLGINADRAKDYDLTIQSGYAPEETTSDIQTGLMKHILDYLYNIK